MAFTVTETEVIQLSGGPRGRIRLIGSFVNDAGSTGGAIQPGNELVGTDVTGARNLRNITSYGFTNRTASNAFQVVQSYDTTHDGDILTITTTLDETFDFWIEGDDAGA